MRKIQLVLFAFVFLLVSLSLSQALIVVDVADSNLASTVSDNNYRGWQVKPNLNLTLLNVTLSTTDTSAFCNLTDDSNVQIASSAVINLNASFFQNLTAGNTYRIVCGGPGSMMAYNGNTFSSLNRTNLNYTNSIYSGAIDNGGRRSIVSLTTNSSLLAVPVLNISVSLLSPASATLSTSNNLSFNATLSPSVANLTNATLFVWRSGVVFNSTTNAMGVSSNLSSWNISGLLLGNYEWNVLGCVLNNSGSSLCKFASSNFTFSIGASIISQGFNPVVQETSYQTFNISIMLLSSSQLSVAQFVYNGTNYTVNDISSNGSTYTLRRSIDIPTNNLSFLNLTRNFFWRFIYTDNSSTNQQTTSTTQNVTDIAFQVCNQTVSNAFVNFTTKNESSGLALNSIFLSTFRYWLGTGTQKNTFVINNQTADTSAYNLCFSNVTSTLYIDSDISYSASGFSDNQYHSTNSSLTNATNLIDLFLLSSDQSTKFYVSVRSGVDPIDGAVVLVSRNFIGEGVYKTVSSALTDGTGTFPLYAKLDQAYRFIVVKNGQILGTFDKTASCSAAPCTITLNVQDTSSSIYTGFWDRYSSNVYSNMTFNTTTNILTYTFVDVTATANYFRLVVKKSSLNSTVDQTICDSFSYTSFGSMTCNVTGYSGDFNAVGTISRSPEKIDQVLSFFIDVTEKRISILLLFASLVLIVTVVFGAAVITRGSPSGILYSLGVAIILLKISTILPFSWLVVSSLEVLIIFLITKVDS